MEKDIHAIIDEVVEHPTLDRFLDRHPGTLKFPEDYQHMVEKVLRPERAMFIKSEQEKKSKKENPDA